MFYFFLHLSYFIFIHFIYLSLSRDSWTIDRVCVDAPFFTLIVHGPRAALRSSGTQVAVARESVEKRVESLLSKLESRRLLFRDYRKGLCCPFPTEARASWQRVVELISLTCSAFLNESLAENSLNVQILFSLAEKRIYNSRWYLIIYSDHM